jgi:hypothetical protein
MKQRNVILAAFFIAAGVRGAAAEVALVLPDSPLRKIAPGGAICVNPVQNLSQQTIGMNGIDNELVVRIGETGYRAGKPGQLETCDATAYTEIVRIGGRSRMSAEVEFRLVLAGEQVPRLSTTAAGKSPKPPRSPTMTVSFVAKGDRDAVRREAILAAFAEQAHKIQIAQRDGMPLYTGQDLSRKKETR